MRCGDGTCGKVRKGDACRKDDCYDCWLRLNGDGKGRKAGSTVRAARPPAPPDRGPCRHLAPQPMLGTVPHPCRRAVAEGRVHLCLIPDEAKRAKHRFVVKEYCRFRCPDHEPAGQ